MFGEKKGNHKKYMQKGIGLFLIPVKDIQIPDIFYKIQKFLRTTRVAVIAHKVLLHLKYLDVDSPLPKKSRIRETPNLSTNAYSSTNIFVFAGVKKGADTNFFSECWDSIFLNKWNVQPKIFPFLINVVSGHISKKTSFFNKCSVQPDLEKAGSTSSAEPDFFRFAAKSVLFSAKLLPNI